MPGDFLQISSLPQRPLEFRVLEQGKRKGGEMPNEAVRMIERSKLCQIYEKKEKAD
jgi:hypothetical protein